MKMKKNKHKIRAIVQIIFFLLIGLIAVNKTLTEYGVSIPFVSTASLHALCPFGGVVTLYNLLTVGTFVQKIHASSVILMALVFVLAVLFGPVFCGWVCPFGTFQEWIGKLGSKIFKKKYNNIVPKKLDKVLRYFRYVVLFAVVYITAKSGYLMFANIDPYNALFTFWTGEVALQAMIILGVTIALSLIIERPWCKYACPYGALLGLSNLIRIFKIKRNSDTCISCKKCDKSCPMNINISTADTIKNPQCISCYECTSENNCSVSDTVNIDANFKSSSSQRKELIKNEN